jgi:di/tricarboxylate transporter
LSAFLNNTPVVSMLIPRVQVWSERVGIPASKLLMPLSFAAIIGGLTTLIGTSTNVVVSGLLESSGLEPLGMFTLSWVGVPAAILVILFFALGGHRLLPEGLEEGGGRVERKDYLFQFRVPPGSSIVGQTVEEAGLRHLGSAYLVHRISSGRLESIDPGVIIGSEDVLAFAGEFRAAADLLEKVGLEPIVDRMPESETEVLPLYEAVVAPTSKLVGQTLKAVGFRDAYGGVVLAIVRRNQSIRESLGAVKVETGDLLLIEAPPRFRDRWVSGHDEFYAVHEKSSGEVRPPAGKAPLVLAIVFGMVLVSALGIMPLVTASFSAAIAMVLFRCVRGTEAHQSIDLKVLLVIVSALGIGQAVESTGLVSLFTDGMVGLLMPFGTIAVMIGLYVATNLLTELITHKAAAVLMVPVAIGVAERLEVAPSALAILVAVAAAASFITPIGYQTNLMVLSAGGYRFKDFLKVGLPVSILVMIVAVAVVWLRWI